MSTGDQKLSPAGAALARGLIVVIVLHAFEQIALVAVLDEVVTEFQARNLSGVLFGAYLLASILGTVYAGPRPIFAHGLALFWLGLIIAGLATSIEMLIFARAVQGAGGGILQTIALRTIHTAFSEVERPRVIAALSTAWVVPGLLGPPVAAALVEALPQLGWRAIFVVLWPIVPLAAWLALRAMRRLDVPAPGDLDTPAQRREQSQILASAAVLCAGVGLVLASSIQEDPVLLSVLLPGGIVVSALGLRRIFPAGTLILRRGLPAAIGLKLLVFLCFFGTDSFIPLALRETRGLELLMAALVLAPASLTWALASVYVARKANEPDRESRQQGYRRFAAVGFGLLSVATAAMIPTLWPGVPIALAFLSWGLAGFGIGVAYVALNSLAMELSAAGNSSESKTAVALNIGDSLGFVLGTTLAGALLAHGTAGGLSESLQYATSWSVFASIALLCALATRRLRILPDSPATNLADDGSPES